MLEHCLTDSIYLHVFKTIYIIITLLLFLFIYVFIFIFLIITFLRTTLEISVL